MKEEKIKQLIYLEEVVKEAEKEGLDTQEMTNIFFEAYDIHKSKYGSYKSCEGLEYTQKMNERYQFMRNYCMDIIKTAHARLN